MLSWERIGGDLQPYGRSCPLEETELKQDAFAGSTGRDVRLFVFGQDGWLRQNVDTEQN